MSEWCSATSLAVEHLCHLLVLAHLKESSRWPAAIGITEHTRSYASSDLATFAVKNKGLRAGPGGRSSVGLHSEIQTFATRLQGLQMKRKALYTPHWAVSEGRLSALQP